MSAPQMSISRNNTPYTLHLSNRGGLSELQLVELLVKVFDAVNPAARVPKGQQSGKAFQALYNEGPLLFNEAAVDPLTGGSRSQLGGLTVTAARLDATLAKLKELGFEILG